MNRGKENKRNRGFTLVEVLIATAILGIMVGPVLSSFVSVARVNVSSRKRLSATTVGESVAEAVKAFGLYDFAKQCDYPTEGFKLLAGDLQSGTAFSGTATELSMVGGSLQEATNKTIQKPDNKFQQSTDRNYYFMIENIPMGGTTYDAVISYEYEITPNAYDIVKDSSGNDKYVKDVLGEYSVRTLNYYNVTIKVYKSSSKSSVSERLSEYTKPLATISGTKADYN